MAGRSRRSPVTWDGTARRSATTWRADGRPGCACGRHLIRWNGFVPYLRAPFADDPQVWASALFDEVVPLGYLRSYPSFVRQVRAAGLRPQL